MVRSRGLTGEVVVAPLTDDPERFRSFKSVLRVDPDGLETMCDVEFVRTHSRQGRLEVHLRMEGVESKEDADALKGVVLGIDRDELGLADDEYLLDDLVGFDVRTADGSSIGRVKDIQRFPAQDLVVVELNDGGEALVPDVPEFVDKSNLEAGQLVVHPIEGLIA